MEIANSPPRHLTYCGNVHPTASAEELIANLERFVPPLRAKLGSTEPLAMGLFFGGDAAKQFVQQPKLLARLRSTLDTLNAYALTANAFPLGDFHAARVKTEVYRPDWQQGERLRYTLRVAQIMAHLPTRSTFQSVSTLPGSYKEFESVDYELIAKNLRLAAEGLERIEKDTGREIVLAVEPEPGCAFETSREWIDFFQSLLSTRSEEHRIRRHLGTCYDTCHQAVEFEDADESLRRFKSAGIRIAKMQMSTALRLERPGDRAVAVERLAGYAEPRYLHQVIAKRHDGLLDAFEDLPEYLELIDSRDDAEARIHFHVPIYWAEAGEGLLTTRPDLEAATKTALELGTVEHFEIETYSWHAIPGAAAQAQDEDLVADIAREYEYARSLLRAT
ncbi:MAG: metabolite traffic protein EboE [Planctomycetota bacterium]